MYAVIEWGLVLESDGTLMFNDQNSNLRFQQFIGATELKIHSKSATTSINYALEALATNLDHLHCSSTQFLRPFIGKEPTLKFRAYSGTEG